MPAESFKQILRYEGATLDAWQQILVAAGIPPGQIFQQFLTAASVTPRIELNVTGAKPTGHRGAYVNGQMTFDAWNAHLITRVVTRRGVNGQYHYDMLAIARYEALYFNERFSPEVFPFHVMTKIQESSTHAMIDPDRDEDISELDHEILISVRRGAWPVPTP